VRTLLEHGAEISTAVPDFQVTSMCAVVLVFCVCDNDGCLDDDVNSYFAFIVRPQGYLLRCSRGQLQNCVLPT
jgi:hypothetical protein